MNYFNTHADLNILPLGSYDMLIGMDWIEKHKLMLNCFHKTFTCIDDTKNTIKVKGIPIKVTIRDISSLQMEISVRKGCKVFVFYVVDDKDNENKLTIEDIPILKDFKDSFPKEVPVLPPKRDINFIIDMILEVVPGSKDPYKINIIEFTEQKSQLQELIDTNVYST